jgi:CRISPR-associated protein Cas1
VSISPSVISAISEKRLSLSYLTEQGRFLARMEPAFSGNVLLRREQYRRADDASQCLALARSFIAAKVQNARLLLLRSAREASDPKIAEPLQNAANRQSAILLDLPRTAILDEARGIEGIAAREYFDAFDLMVRKNKDVYAFNGRSRRPPLDPLNALLSFLYALLRHDCEGAIQAVGLDPAVGFLHADRPGRPSLALDLMEEFRALIADRLALRLINRGQVTPNGFSADPGGAITMDEKTRRTVVSAYQQRKQEEVTHPLLEERVPIGLLPHLQARLLARTIRGDVETYPSLILK